MTYVASRLPTCAHRSSGEAPREPGQEAGPEAVADAGRVDLALLGGALDEHRRLVLAVDPRALGAEGDDPGADPVEDLLGCPAGLLLGQGGLVLVGEQVRRAVDQLPDAGAVHPGDLLPGVGEERVGAGPALLGVPIVRPFRVVRRDDDQVEAAEPAGDRLPARCRGPRASRPRRRTRSGRGRCRWCRRTARCAAARTCAPTRCRRRGAAARTGSRGRTAAPQRRPARGPGRGSPSRRRCWPRCRPGGRRGPRRGTTARSCPAGRPPGSR